MRLSKEEEKQVISFVKKEPRTIQEVSKKIGKSWITTDKYLRIIKENTGLLKIKVFRKGSQGALKLVYYNHGESPEGDEIKNTIYSQIKHCREKKEFDFLEVFQFIPEKKKRCFIEQYDKENIAKNQDIMSLFRRAESQVLCFSGNLSFVGMKEGRTKMLDVLEELLQRKVSIKILTRVNVSSLNNVKKLVHLMKKYPDLIEIRHRYQPLRGFVIDDKIARFKDEEQLRLYKKGELDKDTRIFYEFFDKDWVAWINKVFWNLFRPSMDYKIRLKEIEKLF